MGDVPGPALSFSAAFRLSGLFLLVFPVQSVIFFVGLPTIDGERVTKGRHTLF